MAENHLDYDYLEDEAIDEHFAEDPVGVGMSSVCGERNRLPSRLGFFFFLLGLFVRASVGRRCPLCTEEDEHSINCGFGVGNFSSMSQICCNAQRDVLMRCTRITIDARLQIRAGLNVTTSILSAAFV